MNLLHLITREEPIGGLEIADSRVRIALYKKENKKDPRKIVLVEEPLPPGTFVGGTLRKKDALRDTLKKAAAQVPDTSYYIVSIPPVGVFTKILTFPGAVTGERLDEAVRLAQTFQLPYAADATYVDSERLSTKEKNEVLVAASPRTVIDTYLEVLRAAKIKAVAIEPHPLSLARGMKGNVGPVLVVIPGQDHSVITVIEAGVVRFSRVVPQAFRPTEADLAKEVGNIKNFYTTEFGATPVETPWKELQIAEKFQALLPKSADQPSTLVAGGALARGILPQGSDTLVSLLPVGTEQAYEFQKATAFASFVRSIAVGVSVFFVIAYASAWLFMLSLKAQFSQQSAALAASADSSAILADEEHARQFNELIQTTGQLVQEGPLWSSTIEKIRAATTDGITLTGLTITAPTDPLQLTGIANTRVQLNAFKKSLESASIFSNIVIPLTNLELKENIPFVAALSLAAPENVYPH